MAQIWPTALPDRQFAGLSFDTLDVLVRTDMDVGPAKVRPRSTRPRSRTTRLPIPAYTGQNVKDFEEWYDGVLGRGALAFEWEDPFSDGVVEMRFMERPSWSLVVGNEDPMKRIYSSSFALEIV